MKHLHSKRKYKAPLVKGAPLAQLVECQTLDRKVAGSNLTRGTMLCL